MSQYLLISDAAKEVKVESHVLRYWEEELHLPIKRNELGHRYYTREDVERFKQIKSMKERGLQLKAIKMILKDGKLNVLPQEDEREEKEEERQEQARQQGMAIDIIDTREAQNPADKRSREINREVVQESREEKSRRLQWLLQQLIRETLMENNQELCREIRDSVVKELDYQFRMQEEREEIRDRANAERNEEYYKRRDDLLRKKSRKLLRGKGEKELEKQKTDEEQGIMKDQKAEKKTKKKRHSFF